MNGDEVDAAGGPVAPGSPLASRLDDFAVPALSAGFADRVVAAAETRVAPLPELRRSGGGRGWRIGRGIAVATLGFSALATAAAATGLLQRFDIPVPSPEKVWASLTGEEPAAAPVPQNATARLADPAPAALAPVVIKGPIDTPEELAEAFRRIDEVRKGRSEARRAVIDARIEREIERRRAAGLRVPTPEDEARFRARIDEAQARRESIASDRIAARREELARRVEGGEALTREDFVQNRQQDSAQGIRLQRLQRLREMTPEARREALRRLPPEERRALIEEYRQRRDQWREQQMGQRPSETPALPESSDAGPTAPEIAPPTL